jgi:hypothetical protein
LKKNIDKILLFLFAITCNILTWHIPFFWDSLLTSSITSYYASNLDSNLILPSLIDAGHPPLFYLYIALFYKIFGTSLFAAHLSMFPFQLLFIYSTLKLYNYFHPNKRFPYIFVVLFGISAIGFQASMVSYDFAISALFLFGLYSLLKKRILLMSISLLLINLICLRGLFLSFSLILVLLFIDKQYFKKYLFKIILFTFTPALVWYYYHYIHTGWFLFSESSHWIGQRDFDLLQNFKGNIIGIIRCFTDNGMMLLSLLFIYVFYRFKNNSERKIPQIIMLLIAGNVFILMPFSNPIQQRYFIFIYVLMAIYVTQYLIELKRGNILIFMLATLMIISNIFIYPNHSNSWDTNYLSYRFFALQKNLNAYVENNQIEKSSIYTSFPLFNSNFQYLYKGDTIRMKDISTKNNDDCQYILYSNICNDFDKKRWSDNEQTHTKIYQIDRFPFTFVLYKKNN